MTGIGYVGDWRYAQREIQKAAMRGWSLTNPEDMRRLQGRLRVARNRELRDRARTGGDVA